LPAPNIKIAPIGRGIQPRRKKKKTCDIAVHKWPQASERDAKNSFSSAAIPPAREEAIGGTLIAESSPRREISSASSCLHGTLSGHNITHIVGKNERLLHFDKIMFKVEMYLAYTVIYILRSTFFFAEVCCSYDLHFLTSLPVSNPVCVAATSDQFALDGLEGVFKYEVILLSGWMG
jgi:hypothetical protein